MAYPHELIRAVARGEKVDGALVSTFVVQSAIEHRMTGLLIRAVNLNDVPTDAIAPLLALDMAYSAKRREIDEVLKVVASRLAEAGVTHTFVKGWVSSHRWFPEQSTDRPFFDIDVVAPMGNDFVTAVRVLDPGNPFLAVVEEDGGRAASSVEVKVDGIDVDIQTDCLRSGVVPRNYRDWSVGTDLVDGWLRSMDREHDLIMFLLHQGRDRFRFLLGVAEARRRLAVPTDWLRVERLAREEGIWDQVAVALEVMCDELRIPPPIAAPRGWRARLWRHLWEPDVRLLGEVGRLRHVVRGRWLMPLLTRGRFVDAVRWLIKSAFPQDKLLRLKYPDASGPYLWRAVVGRAQVMGRRRLRSWKVGI